MKTMQYDITELNNNYSFARCIIKIARQDTAVVGLDIQAKKSKCKSEKILYQPKNECSLYPQAYFKVAGVIPVINKGVNDYIRVLSKDSCKRFCSYLLDVRGC
jgi:poly-gamma-glutamate capsule biosynthesis protein CapA/YwtB (metallophosphatase superfamily)